MLRMLVSEIKRRHLGHLIWQLVNHSDRKASLLAPNFDCRLRCYKYLWWGYNIRGYSCWQHFHDVRQLELPNWFVPVDGQWLQLSLFRKQWHSDLIEQINSHQECASWILPNSLLEMLLVRIRVCHLRVDTYSIIANMSSLCEGLRVLQPDLQQNRSLVPN